MQVTEQRTKLDVAHAMQWLVDEGYPEATVIRVMLDNFNTHKIASLYAAFEPAEARRIARKLEFHYTPKYGSWLNAVIDWRFCVSDARNKLERLSPSLPS